MTHVQVKPYKLIVRWRDGRETVVSKGHDPYEVGKNEWRIARNPAVVDRIYLSDPDGPLMTYWHWRWA